MAFLINCILICIFACLATCQTFSNIHERLHLLPYLSGSKFNKLQYGYPVDSIGGLFPTFSIAIPEATYWAETSVFMCDYSPSYFQYLRKDCQNSFITASGVHSIADYNRLKNVYRRPLPFGHRKSGPESQLWERKLLNFRKTRLTSYITEDIRPVKGHYKDIYPFYVAGVLNWRTVKEIKSILEKCSKKISKWKKGQLFLFGCGYGKFMQLLTNKHLNPSYQGTKYEKVLAPANNSINLSALFWYYFCQITWPAAVNLNKNNILPYSHPSCPNHCTQTHNSCSMKENVVHLDAAYFKMQDHTIDIDRIGGLKICQPTRTGVFDNDYKCVCQKGYEWADQTKSCTLVDGCKLSDSKSPCNLNGTHHCISTISTLDSDKKQENSNFQYSCICHPGYMGHLCDKRQDSCIEAPSSVSIPGKQACRVYLGNKCIPRIGTYIYTCECSLNWTQDQNVDFPNCYNRRSICDRVICRKGKCIASKNENTYICLCQIGWRGAHCDQPDIRSWMPWGSWSACSAALCTGLGWRSRIRNCRINVANHTDKGLCSGDFTDRQLCKSMCLDLEQVYFSLGKTVVLFGFACFLFVVAVGLLFIRAKVEKM